MRNLREKQDLPHIQILTGVRRCGKSTAFKLLINDLLKAGVSPKAILNVNLDAPAFIPYWAEPGRLQQIVDTAERLTGTSVEWLFLDEIQQVTDWEVFVKAAYDARRFRKIYITGSNSNLLANRFSSMLAGRYFANEMRPFSLKEVFARRLSKHAPATAPDRQLHQVRHVPRNRFGQDGRKRKGGTPAQLFRLNRSERLHYIQRRARPAPLLSRRELSAAKCGQSLFAATARQGYRKQ